MTSHDLMRSESDVGDPYGGPLFYERNYSGDDGRPTHTHEDAYLIFLLQGIVEETRKRQTSVRTPSMLTVLPAGDPHATCFRGGVRTFEIALPSAWMERLGRYSSLVERYENLESGLPTWLALRLYREFQNQDNVTPLMLEGLLLELLAQMARGANDGAEKHGPRWLRQARDFLHTHYTDSISLDAVAAAVDVHPAHLVRAFRYHYGRTLGDYVRHLRIEHASHLLSTSELSLSQIAYETGFADQSHFSRTFKRFTGMTPSDFRNASGHAGSRQKLIL